MPGPLAAIPDAVALAACVTAAAIDARRHRIPNWLTGTAAACGLVLNLTLGWIALGPAGGVQWLLAALAGAACGLVVFGVPAAFDLVGMGDVKLIAATGALIRWPLAPSLALYSALAGGAVALIAAVRGRRAGRVARNLLHLGAGRDVALHRMPYGLALAIGCAWAVASRYVEALRLVDL